MPQYVYSLNGENWTGTFAGRDAALAAAIQKCSGASDPPGTVFVAEIPAGEALANELGRSLVQEMKTRAASQGIGGATRYLRNVSPSQLAELDTGLEKLVVAWLQKNSLLPESMKVEGISEHPVPLPHMALQR
jgi:hypothetical protein